MLSFLERVIWELCWSFEKFLKYPKPCESGSEGGSKNVSLDERKEIFEHQMKELLDKISSLGDAQNFD